ncbi:MAG: hypothetical protein EOO27_02320 [Comamonadaceae bacterium]|nr:MAG: hypothetical protein EOO27_02320 [Comamonadaceae bacterium]
MLRLYRKIERGEFFVVGGDCAQGGIDNNWGQFISKDRVDVPLVLQMPGVAADMTPILHQTLEWLFDKTGIQPVVALERNMGGASEMERLRKMNRLNKYRIYYMRNADGSATDKPGFNTDLVSRPRLTGDLKVAIDTTGLTIYDEETVSQLSTFIVNRSGKPEAASNTHDDAVMSLGVGWQLYQTENKILLDNEDDDYSSGNVTQMFVKRSW